MVEQLRNKLEMNGLYHKKNQFDAGSNLFVAAFTQCPYRLSRKEPL